MKPNNQYNLFNPPPDIICENNAEFHNNNKIEIPGLTYFDKFISEDEERDLVKIIYKQNWLNDLKRRVQHYGWKYDYRARNTTQDMYLGKLPFWAENLAQRLVDNDLMDQIADQIIINEYTPGQGIANHVDCEPCFGDTIVSLSLSSLSTMSLINLQSKEKKEILLHPRSVISLRGDARYLWSHGVPARLSDISNGVKVERKTRVSITFRKVII